MEERPELYILHAGANEGTSTPVIQRASDSQHVGGTQRDGDSQHASGTQRNGVSQHASGTQRDSTTESASTSLGDQARKFSSLSHQVRQSTRGVDANYLTTEGPLL